MLEFHYRSEADWVEFLRRPKTGAVVADQELLESALAALSGGDAEIVATEETIFSAYDQGPASGRGRR